VNARGIDYSPAQWADEWRLRDSRGLGTGSSLFLEPIDDPDLLVRVERGEALAHRVSGRGERQADRGYGSLGAAAKANWDAAIKACQRGREESTEGWHPAAGYQALLNAFDRLLFRGDAAAAPHARGYGRCMRVRVLGPQIAPWERAHADAIAALHRRWEAMVAKAEGEAGWDWPSGVTDRS
jgi:hypothetical protein